MKTVKSFLTLLLFVTFALFIRTANGQVDGGKILLGGSSNLSFEHSTDSWKSDNGSGTSSKYTNVNLSPTIGIFVVKGLAVGLLFNVSYSVDKFEGTNSETYKSTDLTAEPFIRYYLNTKKIKPYFQINGGGGISNSKTGSSSTDKSSILLIGASTGIGIFLNDNISLDLGIGYSSEIYKATTNNPDNERDIYNNLGISIGIITVL